MLKKTLIILTGVFKTFGINHDELKPPKELYKKGIGLEIFRFSLTVLALVFSFSLKFANMMIEMRFILLGIIAFMLYYGETIVRATLELFNSSKETKYNTMFENEVILRGSKILSEAAGKVQKKDENTKVYSIMSNESIINTIKRYLDNLWMLKIRKVFNILELITTILMLVLAILMNDAIDQRIFIPTIIIFALLSFLISAYISLLREAVVKKNRKYRDGQSEITNDLLRNEPIVSKDISMRISLLSRMINKNSDNVVEFDKKRNITYLLRCIAETISTYGIILLYVFSMNWQDISMATIAAITANIVIVTSALGKIRNVTNKLDVFNDMVTVINTEKQDMQAIMEVYDKSVLAKKEAKEIDEIIVPAFEIRYTETSENDKPFTLTSKKDINLTRGEVSILYGPSGSGKSTFMKLITERIALEKDVAIPSTARYMYYDERLRFGSLNVCDELFCNSENKDFRKMQEILENLNLWQEVSKNCIDVWQYLKEKRYNNFSNGQKQRLILAKMLYWLDETIDVIVLDECTSGLDDITSSNESADAQKILEYLVRFCNQNKSRIVVIATHQNIDKFISSIENDFNIQKFYFARQEDGAFVE